MDWANKKTGLSGVYNELVNKYEWCTRYVLRIVFTIGSVIIATVVIVMATEVVSTQLWTEKSENIRKLHVNLLSNADIVYVAGNALEKSVIMSICRLLVMQG